MRSQTNPENHPPSRAPGVRELGTENIPSNGKRQPLRKGGCCLLGRLPTKGSPHGPLRGHGPQGPPGWQRLSGTLWSKRQRWGRWSCF